MSLFAALSLSFALSQEPLSEQDVKAAINQQLDMILKYCDNLEAERIAILRQLATLQDNSAAKQSLYEQLKRLSKKLSISNAIANQLSAKLRWKSIIKNLELKELENRLTTSKNWLTVYKWLAAAGWVAAGVLFFISLYAIDN